jgi:CheY-like chemotaxis protein
MLTVTTENIDWDGSGSRGWAEVERGRYVSLAVCHLHAAISSQIASSAFEPFSELPQDTGLELAAAYGIVRQHGGYIRIDTHKDNQALFELLLPSIRSAGQEVQRQTLEREVTILVANDNPSVLSLIKDTLTYSGYNVLTAADAYEAVQASRRHTGSIELLLTDYTMPGMNGSQLAGRLVEMRPGMRVMIVSGKPAEYIHDMDCSWAFLEVPVPSEKLISAIRTILGKEG